MTTHLQIFHQSNQTTDVDVPTGQSPLITEDDWATSRQSSSVSAFVDWKEPSSKNPLITDVKWNEILQYSQLVSERIDYLSGLQRLKKDWVSGFSETPSESTINASKALLLSFRNYVQHRKALRLPKLVLGPIPSGGVSLEFHIDESNALFVSIRNGKVPEIEVKYADYYFTFEIETKKLPARLMDQYEAITEK